ncbi:MAG: hypothetical protein IT237_05630 [Bacteroidia bacterium]|nr:hypothetical protein [Bacteroidia bacterium]
MRKKLYFVVCVLISNLIYSQKIEFPENLRKTQVAQLLLHDSLLYYQCHVDTAIQEITTQSGQKIKSKKRRLTITEKFKILLTDSGYVAFYFLSPVTNYPNKKFPYLTLKEVESWEFQLSKIKRLTKDEVLLLSAFETKTHAIVHYELNINKSCPNEVIIRRNSFVEQLIVEGDLILSEILKFH